MADISQTASAVLLISGSAQNATLGSGVTVTQGQPVYVQTDNTLALSDANVSAAQSIAGIALSAGSPGQKIAYAPAGSTVNLGLTLTAGSVVFLSNNVGRLTITQSDIVNPGKTIILGASNADGTIQLNPIIGSTVPA